MTKRKLREFRAYTAPGIMSVMVMVVIFHKTVVVLFSNEKNMLTDELYNCVQSISIFEQS